MDLRVFRHESCSSASVSPPANKDDESATPPPPNTTREPRRDHYLNPATDDYSHATLDEAIATLANLRGMAWLGDAGVTLHILTSLHAQIDQRLPRAVADARDQDYSWAEIADLLGVTRASAWQRYARRTPTNRTPLDPD